MVFERAAIIFIDEARPVIEKLYVSVKSTLLFLWGLITLLRTTVLRHTAAFAHVTGNTAEPIFRTNTAATNVAIHFFIDWYSHLHPCKPLLLHSLSVIVREINTDCQASCFQERIRASLNEEGRHYLVVVTRKLVSNRQEIDRASCVSIILMSRTVKNRK